MELIIYSIIFIFVIFFVLELFLLLRRIILAKIAGIKTTPFSQECKKPTRKFLVIGDSTSYGAGANNSKHSLAGRLAKNNPNVHIDNLSENGMTLKRLKKRLKNIQHNKYDLIFIHIGGMDVLSMTSDAKITKYTARILEHSCALLTNNDPSKIIFVSMNNVGGAPAFRFPLERLLEKRSRNVRDTFGLVCDKFDVTHVALFSEQQDDQLAQQPSRYFARDGIHPNDEGYALWYNKINNHL